jgi:cytochrome c551/c552
MRGAKIGVMGLIVVVGGVWACSSRSSPPQDVQALERARAGKSHKEQAQYVFETYGCQRCHTLREGKFGFTSWGLQRKRESEGCPALLAAMNVIAQIPEEQRTSEQRAKVARFEEFGCTFCHQIRPGEMGLTEVGRRLAALHLPCSGIKRALEER